MRVRPELLSVASALLLIADSALATSLGKLAAPSPDACAVTAKFVGSDVSEKTGKQGRRYEVRWRFEPIAGSAAKTGRCAPLGRAFEVFVPGGSYSTIAKSTVYPISIREPEAGSEIALRLESVVFPDGGARWLIGDGAESYRIRR